MKKIAFLPAILAANIFSMFAQAEETDIAHKNYPVNYDKCDYIVTEPENSGGYNFSRDCKTIYILPPKKGVFTADIRPNWSLLDPLCSVLDSQIGDIKKTQDKISEIRSTLLALDPRVASEAKEIAILTERMNILENDVKNLRNNLENVEGEVAKVDMDMSSRKLVSEFYNLNQNLVYSNQVRFLEMPITSSYITFSDYKADDKTLFKAINGLYISGVKVEAEGTNQVLYKTGNEMSGQVIVGLPKACALFKEYASALEQGQKWSRDEVAKELSVLLSPVFSYSYQVMSTISYEAQIDFKSAVETVLQRDEFKDKFTVGSLVDALSDLSASNIVSFKIDLGDISSNFLTEEQKTSFVGELREQVMERLAAKFAAELEKYNFVQPMNIDSELSVPEPGHIEVKEGTRSVCETKSFLGTRISRKCRNQVITRKIPQSGNLDEAFSGISDISIIISESLEINENVLVPGTSGF